MKFQILDVEMVVCCSKQDVNVMCLYEISPVVLLVKLENY